MNFKSQGTVWDCSKAEALAGLPDQQMKSAEEAFDAFQRLCAATGGAGRKNRLLNYTRDSHPGLYFWLQPSRHLPAQCPFPWHCCSIKALFCPLLPGFADGAWEDAQHSRVLNSPGPSRKHVGLWSQRLLSGFVVEQVDYKGNIFTPFFRTHSRKKKVNEAQKCYGVGCFVSSFPVDCLCLEIYKIAGKIKYHKYSAHTCIKAQNHISQKKTQCLDI